MKILCNDGIQVFPKNQIKFNTTLESMLEDGFGKNPLFEFFVAEENDLIIGIALYYWRYSTWKGRVLYLEDFVVREDKRGLGIGKMLFQKLVELAKETNSRHISWQVLDWNEPAIRFYKRLQSDFDAGWLNCRLQSEYYDVVG
jgi:GNAT superfamily N-acetyltransferase